MKKQFYGTSTIKRERRTKDEIGSLKQILYDLVQENQPMTVRQVFYQMVTRGYIPKSENAYRSVVCRLLKELRLDRIMPFNWISDNTRYMRKPESYDSIEQLFYENVRTYRRSIWNDQPIYIEFWCEKDALAGVIYEVTKQWDIPLMIARGFSSITFLYSSAEHYENAGKPVYIYYLGDMDPSGLCAVESAEKRMREFAPNADIHFERIAVTEEQIKLFKLPTRPTKASDTRSRNFQGESVELDALPPHTLQDLVEYYIVKHIDTELWVNTQKIEKLERESLLTVANGFRRDK